MGCGSHASVLGGDEPLLPKAIVSGEWESQAYLQQTWPILPCELVSPGRRAQQYAIELLPPNLTFPPERRGGSYWGPNDIQGSRSSDIYQLHGAFPMDAEAVVGEEIICGDSCFLCRASALRLSPMLRWAFSDTDASESLVLLQVTPYS